MRKKTSELTKKIKFIGAVIVVLGLAVGGGIWMVRAQESDRRINEIAKHFKCICEMNCNLTVAACTCKEKNGAVEKKAFIKDLLKEGKSNSEIMVLFNQKYGGLIE